MTTDSHNSLSSHIQSLVEIVSAYEVADHGGITTAGKFEGEMLYVPLLWEAFLNGDGNEGSSGRIYLHVVEDDKAVMDAVAKLPVDTSDYDRAQRTLAGRKAAADALRKKQWVTLRQTDSGFIVEA